MNCNQMKESRLKHLEMVQAIVARLSGYSFAFRGLTITMAVAVVSVLTRSSNVAFLIAAIIGVCVLWGLDSYYLSKERQFRALYDLVRAGSDESDMNLSTTQVPQDHRRAAASVSPAVWPFYIAVIALIVAGAVIGASVVTDPS